MSKKAFYLSILLVISLNSFGQSQKFSPKFINLKDTQCVKMVRYFNKAEMTKLRELFPGYKNFVPTLIEIKKLANANTFSMRPNFLSKYQDEKTKIFLSISKSDNSAVLTYLIVFTSNSLNSKIESIVRDKRFDQPTNEEKIIEIKPAN